MSRKSTKLWFDPKNPPKTPVYVGQKIPIYIVPDETTEDDRLVEDTWELSDFFFKVVAMRNAELIDEDGNRSIGKVVDVEWPNGHIDTHIPISNMYGHFARLKKSWIPRYTEEYYSDEDEYIDIDFDPTSAKTDQEKLEQLLFMLQYLNTHSSSGDDGSDDDTTNTESKDGDSSGGDEGDDGDVDISEILNKDPEKVKTNQEKLEQLLAMLKYLSKQREKITNEDQPVVTVEETTDDVTVADTVEDDCQSKVTLVKSKKPKTKTKTKKTKTVHVEDRETYTRTMIRRWFRQPSKGGLCVVDLRNKARKMGISSPQKYKKAELKTAMLNAAQE